MHILDCSKQYKNKLSECLLLSESYRDEKGTPRHRTILNLSKLPKKLSEVIIQQVKGKTMVSLEGITQEDNRDLGEVTVLKRLSDKTGISQILKEYLGRYVANLVLAMTINRISLPKAKYSLSDWLETTYLPELLKTPLDKFHYNQLYQALKILSQQQELIEDDLWKKTKEKEKGLTLMLYDITSTYLEGLENELAAFGYNRDKKKGKKQIVIALTTTKQGRPVTVEVLKGNTADKTTLIPKVAKIQQRFKVKNIVYVFDRGMKDEKKLDLLQAKEIKYITALTRTEINKLTEKNQEIQLSLFDQEIAEYQISHKRYLICQSDQKQRSKRKRELLLQKTEEELEKIKQSIANKRLKDPLKISARAERWLSRWRMKKYFEIQIKERYFNYQRKQNVIEATEVLDGVYVLETNVSKDTLSTLQVQKGYKNLCQVENNFRVIKSALDVRPIHHRREDTTRGHVFICFLALYLRKELELKLKPLFESKKHKNLTFAKIQTKLREIRQSLLQADEHQAVVINKLDGLQKDILKTLRMRIQPIQLPIKAR